MSVERLVKASRGLAVFGEHMIGGIRMQAQDFRASKAALARHEFGDGGHDRMQMGRVVIKIAGADDEVFRIRRFENQQAAGP